MSKRILLGLSTILFCSNFIYSMDSEKSWNNWESLSDAELEKHHVHGYSLLDLKQVYQTAPEKVKNCVEHLKDPDFYPAPEYRLLILYGPSGSGKSSLARAMAQYAGWDAVPCTPATFQVGHRNDAADNFRKKIDELLGRGTPTLLIIDEVNQLLENADSKHHDNDATSKEFWMTMDRIYGKDNFFIVGTTNRIFKFPEQIKTRIKARSCEIIGPQTLEDKILIFKNRMNRTHTELSHDAYKWAKKMFEKYPKWTPRDYSELAFEAKDVFREKDKKTKPIIITAGLLDEAARRAEKYEGDSEYHLREMTDDERQDFYQAQNILSQLLIQYYQKNTMAGFRSPGIIMANIKEILNRVTPVNQRRLIEENLDIKKIFEDEDAVTSIGKGIGFIS